MGNLCQNCLPKFHHAWHDCSLFVQREVRTAAAACGSTYCATPILAPCVVRAGNRSWNTRRGSRRSCSSPPVARPRTRTFGDRAGPRYAADERSDIPKNRIRGAGYDDQPEERTRRLDRRRGVRMRRRELLLLLATEMLSARAIRAQQKAMPVIGFLSSTSPEAYASRVAAFRQGLSEVGYVEGRDVEIEYRWAEGRYDRLPTMATDLVRRQVTVIVAITTPAAIAAKAATATIPIVFEMGTDPVEAGLVASLNRPGGNLTGVSLLNVELAPKRLELLHEIMPAPIIGLLVNPDNRNAEIISAEVQAAARTLRLELHVLHASTDRDFVTALANLTELGAGGLVIGSDPFFNTQSQKLAGLLLRHSLPAIYQYREFAAAGGLMSYGGNITDPFRQAGSYTGRVLRGDKPAELPVVQSTKIELVINLSTARALGLTGPPSILARADEVIE